MLASLDPVERFTDEGVLGPVPVLSEDECRRFLNVVRSEPQPPDWYKGYAATSRAFYEVARHPTILEVLSLLLGDDIMVWGASVVTKSPGEIHPWHCDVETSHQSAKAVAVWIGLKNTSRDSALVAIPYSHRFGCTIQEVRHELDRKRDEVADEEVLGWARQRDRRARLVDFDIRDGEALLFDGRLWHGSRNALGRTRYALLLQYATPDTEIRIPDLTHLDWPFRYIQEPRPACLVVKGKDTHGLNRMVSPPPMFSHSDEAIPTGIWPFQLPLTTDETGWKPYPIFNGSTAGLRELSCHASALEPGACPHPPHRHGQEEILLVLKGEVELDLPDEEGSRNGGRRRLTRGEFTYYPAGFAHTLTTVGSECANYMMFRWQSRPAGRKTVLRFGRYRAFDTVSRESGFAPRIIFEGPTRYLRKLHCHSSIVTPGAGYEAHVDAYDVAIVLLEGEIETLGERVGPHGVVFYRAGEPHGLRNSSDTVAKYLVLEFHPESSTRTSGLRRFLGAVKRRLLRSHTRR